MDEEAKELDCEHLRQVYRTMVRIRLFEERVADLIESGEIRTPCHLCIGQEAIAAGVCAALRRDDFIWGAHRSHGHYLAKGGDLKALMAEIFCRTTGCSRGRGGSMHICAPEVGLMGTVPIVAATIPIAVGVGLASALRGDGRVSVAFFGDGATEEGHFHESLNLAALRKLPVIFICENNFYSSHLSLLQRRARDNIIDSATAHAVPGVCLDGNDLDEVFSHTVAAVRQARNGRGPTLLECRTFRWRGHVGPSWDWDVGVKRKEELQEWLKRDPLQHTCRHLLQLGVGRDVLDDIRQAAGLEIDAAVEFARRSPRPQPSELTEHIFTSSQETSAQCA